MEDLNMPDVVEDEKMTKDFQEETASRITEARSAAQGGNLTGAIDSLLALEKQTRTAADMHSTSKILVCIVELFFEAGDWKGMQENIVMLSKRRGQLKAAVTKMVQKAMEYLDKTPSMETKLELIDTLRDVTAGKIYVEIERARLTMTLAHIKEGQGNVAEAADILQELQVETFGSMEKKEKINFILEQMRLCLAKKDLIRTHIISKKVTPRSFDNNKLPEEKLRYYRLMVELEEHDNEFLNICRHYMQIYDTEAVKADDAQWKEVLRNMVTYVVLAPYAPEQWDLVNRVIADKLLQQLPFYKELLQTFVTQEVMPWQKFTAVFADELFKVEAMTKCFKDLDRKEEMRKRVVEHNLRVIAKCYQRITMKRLSEIMEQTPEQTEEYVSRLVTGKMIFAKIDRPSGIVDFAKRKDPNEGLNEWVNNVNDLMGSVEKSIHLINLSRSWSTTAQA